MDQWEATGGGLFRLRREGVLTPVTSYVDRSLQRGEQIDQLQAVLGWLPEQVISAIFDQIIEGKYSPPSEIRPVSGGRLLVPTPAMLAVLLAPTEAEGSPLRRYLWPALDEGYGLVLEPGEALLDRKWTRTPGAMKYGDHAHGHLTTHRIATIAKLSLPTQQRGDYKLSLGLISPTLMDGYAMLKQIGRIGQNKHRHWVQHVRYEWLTSIVKRTTKVRKKKLFGGWGPERVTTTFLGEMRYPWGKTYSVDLWRCSDERIDALYEPEKLAQQAAEFEQSLEKVCRDRGLGWTLSDSTAREVLGGTEAKDVFILDPDAAYSIPAELLGAQ